MAALLHDVIEDTGCTKADLVKKFGSKVTQLVEGLTKLDKLEFQSHAEAQAESFRKMFMTMARGNRKEIMEKILQVIRIAFSKINLEVGLRG